MQNKFSYSILACDSHFAKTNETHPTGALIATATRFFWLIFPFPLYLHINIQDQKSQQNNTSQINKS